MTTKTTKTTKVTGDTFAAKDVLRQAGFEWDHGSKSWLGTDEAAAELDRITRPVYSRKNSKAISGCTISKL